MKIPWARQVIPTNYSVALPEHVVFFDGSKHEDWELFSKEAIDRGFVINFCCLTCRVWSWTLRGPWNASVRLAHGLQVWHWRLFVVLLQYGLSSAGGEGDCVPGRWAPHVECPSAKVCGYVVNCFYSVSVLIYVCVYATSQCQLLKCIQHRCKLSYLTFKNPAELDLCK